jgi:hypothetical protein
MWLRPPRRRRKGPIECTRFLGKTSCACLPWPSRCLAAFAVASAQTATPDSENGRYSFNPVADGVLRLDTRTGQVSQCSRSDAEVDKVISFLEKVWRRLIEMGRTVQKDVDRRN